MLIIGIIIAASACSFGLGFMGGLEARAYDAVTTEGPAPEAIAEGAQTGQVVASKSGSKYYYPSCAGASRISPANKIWFSTEDEAAAAGYSLATNCKAN